MKRRRYARYLSKKFRKKVSKIKANKTRDFIYKEEGKQHISLCDLCDELTELERLAELGAALEAFVDSEGEILYYIDAGEDYTHIKSTQFIEWYKNRGLHLEHRNQCKNCVNWDYGDSSIGLNSGCDNENLWDEEAEQLHDNALDYQVGEIECPFKKVKK